MEISMGAPCEGEGRIVPMSMRTEPAAGFAGLVGQSKAMLAVFAQIRRYAASMAPVHIFGETGTGKEKVAYALHTQSRRARGPFVAVNAAAVGDEIFDAEFFGHVRGAFTGASINREGYVAAADGGTLFIDEVADLSQRVQIKLLRFLQEKEYRRVGESQLRHADVRIVAATNASLESRVAEGSFREDLRFRLDILSLRLPPLRERAGDIIPLAEHLLACMAEEERRPRPRLSEPARRALESYRWPGNVRELQREMRRVVVDATGGVVLEGDLSPEILAAAPPAATSLAQARDNFEREHVRRVLAACGGNRTRAAEQMGMTRQGLGLMMKRLGMLERDDDRS